MAAPTILVTCLQTGALVSLRLSPEEAIFLAQATDKVCFYHKTTGHLCLEVKPMHGSNATVRSSCWTTQHTR